MELRQLEVGQVFELGGHEWLVLEHDIISESTLITTTECIRDMAFDTDNSNDFRNSTIRKYLNFDFLEELLDGGLEVGDLIYTDFDLTRHKGETDYGVCRDIIGLLTEEQFRKHRDILALNDWWWLLTPNSGSSNHVRGVNTGGSLSNLNAYNGYIGVRPALSLKASTEVIADKPVELDNYSSEELLQELLRRENI